MRILSSRLVALALIVSLTGGCTGYKQVSIGAVPPVKASIIQHVRVGDTLQVTLRDGSRQKVTVTAIEDEALVGKNGQRIALAGIVGVERRGFTVAANVLLGLGVYILLSFLLLATDT